MAPPSMWQQADGGKVRRQRRRRWQRLVTAAVEKRGKLLYCAWATPLAVRQLRGEQEGLQGLQGCWEWPGRLCGRSLA